jgi:hypothetical protein
VPGSRRVWGIVPFVSRCPDRNVVRGSGSLAIEVLQEIMGSEFDLLVSPLRGSVLAGDQAGSVHSPEIAVDEAVPGLGVLTCTFGQSEEPFGVVFP